MAERPPRYAVPLLLVVFFLSGFISLVYEVLWLKELRDIFGNTAYATATTLAAFFLGLSAGSLFWGRRTHTLRSPVATYALVELGIALSSLLYLLIHQSYEGLYPRFAQFVGPRTELQLALKFALAVSLLVPPAFFMGGTLPIIGHALVIRSQDLARRTSFLYALNTAGAALGALTAGFFLPPALGFKGSFFIAFSLNLLLAAGAWSVRDTAATLDRIPEQPPTMTLEPGRVAPWLVLLVFFTGFISRGLEVLWVRLLSQVTLNCVYSFSLILVWFLVALALGGALAHVLARRGRRFEGTLYLLVLLAAVTVAISPLLLFGMTDGFAAIYREAGFAGYVGKLSMLAAVTVGVPGLVIGSILPYTLKAREAAPLRAGRTIGVWWAINTLGGIAGSLLAGFVLLDLLGVWRGLALSAALCLVMSMVVAPRLGRIVARGAVAGILGLVLIPPLVSRPFAIKLNADRQETVVDVWEGSHATVSVIRARPESAPGQRAEDLLMRMNNLYTLGGLGSLPDERRQAHLPLLLHPEPRSVFFLGMATGITAGAALDHPVDRVVVAELVPDVVVAAKEYFEPDVNGLFEDRRVLVVADDGRSYLLREEGRFDIIIADLFRPWAAGTGTLYTREHFELVRDRLAEGAVFAQWLPLYQLSRREFGVIVRTLLDVFPQVTLWRGNFNSDKPTVALVAQRTPAPLSPEVLRGNLERLPRNDERFDVLVDMLVRVRGEGYRQYDAPQRAFLSQLVRVLMPRTPFTFTRRT